MAALKSNLQNISRKADEATIINLITDHFIQNNTQFNTFQELLDAGGIKSVDDVLTETFATFIASKSRFANWQELHQAAFNTYMQDDGEIKE